MHFTKLPLQKTDDDENLFVGIVDASGSMFDCWKDLVQNYNKSLPKNSITITFDQEARLNPQQYLTDDLTNHGGGSTNIVAAFELLEQQLEQVVNKKVTVLFISDGEDNYDYMFEQRLKKLRGNHKNLELNFLVLGLGNEFNQETALKFRNLYHNGNPDLTQIYHLEEPDVRNLIMTFESLKNQLVFSRKVKTDEKHSSYPFEDKTDCFYSGQWILMDTDKLSISGVQVDVSQDCYSARGISQCFRKWANRLKLERFSYNHNSVAWAQQTLQKMQNILEDYKEKKSVDFSTNSLQYKTDQNKSDFYQRIEDKYMFNIHRTIQQSLKTVEEIANSENVLDWNVTKSRHKIAKKPPVVTQNKNQAVTELQFVNFGQIKKNFMELCKKLDLKNVEVNSESLKLLKNSDFFEAFQMIGNSHQLSQSFPLKGFGVYQKIQDLQIFYPWICTIKKIALKERQFQSTEVFDNFGQIKIKNYPKKPYFINSVLPLFTQKDNHQLSVVLYSDLFQLLLNNNCTKKSDLKVEEGHLAFLGNCLIYLLGKSNQKLEKKQLVEKIFLNLSYYEETSLSFVKTIDRLSEKQNYLKVIKEEVLDYMNKLKQLEISRILCQVLLKFRKIQDTKEQRMFLKNSLQFLMYLYLQKGKSVSAYKYFNFDFFNTPSGQKMQLEIQEEMKQQFEHFKTLGDFNKQLINLYREKLKTSNPKLLIKKKEELEKLFSDKINTLTLINIWENLLEEQFDMRILEDIIFYSASVSVDSVETIDFEKLDLEEIKNGHKKVQFKALAKKVFPKVKKIKTLKKAPKNKRGNMRRRPKKQQEEKTEQIVKQYDGKMLEIPEFQQMKKQIRKQFRNYFKEIHYEVMPINSKQLDVLINQNKQLQKRYKKKPLQLNSENYLLQNACLAPKCQFYLKPINNLHHHYYTWQPEIPPHFHIFVKENYKKSVDEIFEDFKEYFREEEDQEFEAQQYERTVDQVKQYIQKLKDKYESILTK